MADPLLALYDLLASLTEPEWAALSPLLAPHRPYLPPDGRPLAERAAAVVQVVEQRGLDRAVLEARIQEIRRQRPPSELLVAVVAVRAELDEAASRVEARLGRLRGVRVQPVDPTEASAVDAISQAELRVVLLGAAVGGEAGQRAFELALTDPARRVGLLRDRLSREERRPWRDDAARCQALLDRFDDAFTPFVGADAVVAALEEPLQAWLEINRPEQGGLLRPWERAWLRAREPEWEQGTHRHLLSVVNVDRLGREDLYVSLHAGPGPWGRDEQGRPTLAPRERAQQRQEAPGEAEEPLFLDELLSLPALSAALVEGEAGGGKTVLLQHLALCLARDHLSLRLPAESRLDLELLGQGRALRPVPVLLEAAALAVSGASRSDAVLRMLVELFGAEADPAVLRADLREGRYLLLVDALDEVHGAEARAAVLSALAGLARACPRTRLVLTSRPGAHTGVSVPAPFQVVPVAPLDAERRGQLVGRWAASQRLDPAEAEDVSANLSELEGRFPEDPSGRSPLTNPLLCTAALLVYWQERRLPENTADLYERLVHALCRCRPDAARGESAESFLRWLVVVGMTLQERGETALPLRDAAGALVRAGFGASQVEAEERVHRLVSATGLLRTETTKSGVVVRPWHRSFQEYLAAAALDGERGAVALIARRLDEPRGRGPSPLTDPFWTGALRLCVGVFGRGGRPQRAVELVEAWLSMADEERAKAEDGRSEEARKVALRREGHLLALVVSAVSEYRAEHFEGWAGLDLLPRRIADRYEAGGIAWGWRDRVAALDALGRLGDPRLPDPRASLEGWVEARTGQVAIGGDKGAFQSLPTTRFELGPCFVRRHPVTVAEYAAFLETDPARRPELWEGPAEPVPYEWRRQCHHPNMPVTGVTWYAARAFCRWAQDHWRLPARGLVDLPTSREREAIANGDRGGPYPWGSPEPGQDDEARACHDWGKEPFKGAVPVGAFPRGHAAGMWDLSGNVWEWCATEWDGRSDERDLAAVSRQGQGRVVTTTWRDSEIRVLRGGSWNYPARGLRCAFRDGDLARSRGRFVGFRVLLRVPPSFGR